MGGMVRSQHTPKEEMVEQVILEHTLETVVVAVDTIRLAWVETEVAAEVAVVPPAGLVELEAKDTMAVWAGALSLVAGVEWMALALQEAQVIQMVEREDRAKHTIIYPHFSVTFYIVREVVAVVKLAVTGAMAAAGREQVGQIRIPTLEQVVISLALAVAVEVTTAEWVGMDIRD